MAAGLDSSAMGELRAVVFDFDGLIIDSEMPIEVVGAAVAASGEDEAGDLLATWLAIPLDARMRILQVPESSVHGG